MLIVVLFCFLSFCFFDYSIIHSYLEKAKSTDRQSMVSRLQQLETTQQTTDIEIKVFNIYLFIFIYLLNSFFLFNIYSYYLLIYEEITKRKL